MARGPRDWRPAGGIFHKTPDIEEDERRWREAHQPGRPQPSGGEERQEQQPK